MNCKHCNSTVPETSKFCPECGTQLKTQRDLLIEKLRDQLRNMSALELLRLIAHKESIMEEISECLKSQVNEFVSGYQRHAMFQAIIEKLVHETIYEIYREKNNSFHVSDSNVSLAISDLLESDEVNEEDKKWLSDFRIMFNTDRKEFMKSIFNYLTEYHDIQFEKEENHFSFFSDYDLSREVISPGSTDPDYYRGLKFAVKVADTLESLSSPWGIAKTILKTIDK